MQDDSDQRRRRMFLPPRRGRLGYRDELVDVSGDALVKSVLIAVQTEGDGLGVPIREEPLPVCVLEVFFQASERPR